jgi:hypothetical protein
MMIIIITFDQGINDRKRRLQHHELCASGETIKICKNTMGGLAVPLQLRESGKVVWFEGSLIQRHNLTPDDFGGEFVDHEPPRRRGAAFA